MCICIAAVTGVISIETSCKNIYYVLSSTSAMSRPAPALGSADTRYPTTWVCSASGRNFFPWSCLGYPSWHSPVDTSNCHAAQYLLQDATCVREEKGCEECGRGMGVGLITAHTVPHSTLSSSSNANYHDHYYHDHHGNNGHGKSSSTSLSQVDHTRSPTWPHNLIKQSTLNVMPFRHGVRTLQRQ